MGKREYRRTKNNDEFVKLFGFVMDALLYLYSMKFLQAAAAVSIRTGSYKCDNFVEMVATPVVNGCTDAADIMRFMGTA